MKHQKILDDIWAAYEKKYNETNGRRSYLGMSVSEANCQRLPWLEFRHGFDPHIDYMSASFFDDGHYSEAVMIQRIKDAGYDLITEIDGSQAELQDMYWHHGHMDGYFRDLDALWEHKSTSDEKIVKLKKLIATDESTALKEWDSGYYDQATRYMGYSGVHKHILTASAHGTREKLNSKGDFRTAIVETLFDEDHFNYLKERAKHIITTDKMPAPAWSLAYDKPLCVWKTGQCQAYNFCKGRHIGAPNCRNCAYVTFTTIGAECSKHNKALDEKEMVGYYDCHKYLPDLVVGYELIGMTEEGDVVYRKEDGTEIINSDSKVFYKEFNGG